MSGPTKTCYDCKNAYWDSVPYGSTTATMFGGCDKAEEIQTNRTAATYVK